MSRLRLALVAVRFPPISRSTSDSDRSSPRSHAWASSASAWPSFVDLDSGSTVPGGSSPSGLSAASITGNTSVAALAASVSVS